MAREVEQVRRALRSAAVRLPEVFAPGTPLVVAFSGGQDSTCMLHALAHSHRDLRLIAAHIDHGLKAESADAAARAVALAEEIGVPTEVRRVDVPAYRASTPGFSVQHAARAARYQALADVVEEQQATALLVAHTADDQAETLLLHLLRGAGLAGLKGMQLDETLDLRQMGPALLPEGMRRHAVRLARPLLKVSRGATLAYCKQFGLHLVEDASNQTRAYTRNRVRLDVLPVLARFNPSISEALARTAELAAEDAAALDRITGTLHAQLAHNQTYDLQAWRAQPRALQRRLLRLGLEMLLGGLADVTDAPVEDALDLLQTGQAQQTYHLPHGVELCIGSHNFYLQLDGRAQPRERRNTWERGASRV